jgi:hypothetical protein
MARHFLEENHAFGYSALRPWLLTFCLREMINPEILARVALSVPVGLPDHRIEKLVNDWPLRHVYRACTLAWD